MGNSSAKRSSGIQSATRPSPPNPQPPPTSSSAPRASAVLTFGFERSVNRSQSVAVAPQPATHSSGTEGWPPAWGAFPTTLQTPPSSTSAPRVNAAPAISLSARPSTVNRQQSAVVEPRPITHSSGTEGGPRALAPSLAHLSSQRVRPSSDDHLIPVYRAEQAVRTYYNSNSPINNSTVTRQASSAVSHKSTATAQQSQNKLENCNVFVRNLDRSISQVELKNAFARYGEVASCRVVTDANGACKGFAFVNFSNPSSARNAVHCLNNAKLSFNSRPVHVDFAREKEKENESGIKLFVSNIAYDITEASLRMLFSNYCTISYMKLHMNDSGTSKGSAIIRFADEAEGVMAMTGLNGTVLGRRPLRVERAKDNKNNNNGARTNQATVKGQPKKNERMSSKPDPSASAQSSTECAICLEEPLERVFSCGHASCAGCATRLSTCHICRKPITSRMLLFI